MSAVTALPSLLAGRRGKLILILLCSVAFLDFVDTTIVNVALPTMRFALHMSVQRHEQAFGVLETDVQKRVKPGFPR